MLLEIKIIFTYVRKQTFSRDLWYIWWKDNHWISIYSLFPCTIFSRFKYTHHSCHRLRFFYECVFVVADSQQNILKLHHLWICRLKRRIRNYSSNLAIKEYEDMSYLETQTNSILEATSYLEALSRWKLKATHSSSFLLS